MAQNLSAIPGRRRVPTPGTTASNYAHPPLVAVVMRVALTPVLSNVALASEPLAERLGPEWQRRPDTDELRAFWGSSSHPGEESLNHATILGDQRIRVTRSSLEFAWDGRHGEVYPHYEAIRDGLVRSWDAWADTLSALHAPPQTATSWRLGYLNRIPQGTVWQDLQSLQFLLPLQTAVPSMPGLGPLHKLEGHWAFPVSARPELAMTFTVDLLTELATAGNPVTSLWLNLQCAGQAGDGDSPVLDGLDAARSQIVESFAGLVTPSANEYWGLQHSGGPARAPVRPRE